MALTAGNHGIVVHFGEQDGENVLILAYSGSDTGNPFVVVPATGHYCRWCSLGSQPSPSQTYETLDRAPLAGLAYYRQRLVDHGGTTASPPIVAIMMTTRRAATNGLAAQVLPNPALVTGPLNLWVQQDVTVPVPLTINDLQRRVLHRQALPAALVTELPLALRGGGVYLLHLNSATNTITQKLMVQ